jgi:hypothetical protein
VKGVAVAREGREFEVDGTDVAGRRVASFYIRKAVDLIVNGAYRFCSRFEFTGATPFALDTAKKALCYCIIPAVAFSVHALHCAS